MEKAILVYIVVFCLAIAGWGMNIYKLTQCDFSAPYKAEVVRGIGVFVPPVGAVAGYLHIDD